MTLWSGRALPHVHVPLVLYRSTTSSRRKGDELRLLSIQSDCLTSARSGVLLLAVDNATVSVDWCGAESRKMPTTVFYGSRVYVVYCYAGVPRCPPR